MIRTSNLILSCALLAACAGPSVRSSQSSSSAAQAGHRSAKVTLRDYRAGLELAIVNDSLLQVEGVEGTDPALRRASYYSLRKRNPNTKIADDEVLIAVIDAMDRRGFDSCATSGPAPLRSLEATTSIEVWRGRSVRHMTFRLDLDRLSQETYRDCRLAFREVYNHLDQYQSAAPGQFNLKGSSSSPGNR